MNNSYLTHEPTFDKQGSIHKNVKFVQLTHAPAKQPFENNVLYTPEHPHAQKKKQSRVR